MGISGKWAGLLLITSLIAATACGSDERRSGAPVAGGGGAETTAAAGSGGAGAGSEAGGSEAGGSEAGGAAGAPTTIDFSQHRRYQHLIEPFQTVDECLAAQNPEFFINCYHEVDFCSDGSVVMIVTDVQEQGSYVVGTGVIDAAWPEAFEAPAELRFTILSPHHLVDDIQNWDWLLAEDETISYCP